MCVYVSGLCMLQGVIPTSSPPWEISIQRKGSKITINGNTIIKTESSWPDGTAVISDSVTLQYGSSVKKRWSFTLKKGIQQTIGLVTAAYKADRDGYINQTTNGWGFYQGDGKKGHGGPANAAYGSRVPEGAVVDGAHSTIGYWTCHLAIHSTY